MEFCTELAAVKMSEQNANTVSQPIWPAAVAEPLRWVSMKGTTTMSSGLATRPMASQMAMPSVASRAGVTASPSA